MPVQCLARCYSLRSQTILCETSELKLVTEFLHANEAELAASTLEASGIATFISNGDSARLPVASSFAGGVGLWVLVDEQLEDAQELLENPDHDVKVKLSDAEREEINRVAGELGLSGALGLLFRILGATVLFAILIFAITRF